MPKKIQINESSDRCLHLLYKNICDKLIREETKVMKVMRSSYTSCNPLAPELEKKSIVVLGLGLYCK